MFIFDRCCRSSAAVTPVKYECDTNNLTGTSARSKILLTEKLTNGALVTPTHGHETCVLHCYLHYGEQWFEKVSWIPFIIENDYWNLSQVLSTSGVNINKISQYENCLFFINSLWPSDAIWGHRCGSTLAQVMFSVIILACCLMVPSHYLN